VPVDGLQVRSVEPSYQRRRVEFNDAGRCRVRLESSKSLGIGDVKEVPKDISPRIRV
jgi:hypothetical protein